MKQKVLSLYIFYLYNLYSYVFNKQLKLKGQFNTILLFWLKFNYKRSEKKTSSKKKLKFVII